MTKKKIMPVFGTRPEAVKMAPLIKALEKESGLEVVVVVTGQHKDQLEQVLDAFDITPSHNLDIMKHGQTLVDINTAVLTKLDAVLKLEEPDMVLVHGDTSTSFSAGMCAYYNQIPIGHVEAGLRSFDKYQPFPEEINRKLLGHVSDIHFAPTELSKENLQKENVKTQVYVTGNTAIDAMAYTIKQKYVFSEKILNEIDYTKKLICVTAHRRENLGEPLKNICNAVLEIKKEYPDVIVVYPVHLNPKVREVAEDILGGHEGIYLTEPLDIFDMHNLINKSHLMLTDSGGLQEEAPHLNVPVLVLRNVTERPEGIEAGVSVLVGTDKAVIKESVNNLLTNEAYYRSMADGVNPYGDGRASERIVRAIRGYWS